MSSCPGRRAAELVEAGDLVDCGHDGEAVGGCEWPLFLERHLHAAIYARRAEVGAICHVHTPSILSFGVAETPVRAVIHSARFLDVDRIALCPRCGFSGGRVDEEVVWDKLALVASAAAELLG